MLPTDTLRQELQELLDGGNAHLPLDAAIRDFSADLRGRRPTGLPYSGWELLEHLRITQHDILEFIKDPAYESPPWPEGYWPPTPTPPDDRAWAHSVKSFRADRRVFLELIADPTHDLHARIPHGDGQTLLREALLIADHTAYHIGQLIAVRRLLGNWPPES